MISSRKIFQIHPTLYCNYTCNHCYSASSPENKKSLSFEMVAGAIKDGVDMGYETMSISGGEPMLYPHLMEVLKEAKHLGMNTSIITNGSFPENAYTKLEKIVDVIGVSLDGSRELHNQVRKNTQAFDKVDRFLGFSANHFPATGIAYSLSDQSWENLPDMLNYASSKRIDLFQIHPIENMGRANEQSSTGLTSANLKRAFVFVNAIKCQYPFPIQLDVFNKEIALNTLIGSGGSSASDFIDLIVMNEKGKVLPYNYGVNAEWTMADLNTQSFAEGWTHFKQEKLKSFSNWCQSSIESMTDILFAPSEPFMIQCEKKLSLVKE